MTIDQAILFAILAAVLGLFVWGRWRYDVVAMMALMACVLTGIVPAQNAFAGFGEPAVILVALVLGITRALANSGLIETVGQIVARHATTPFTQRAALCLLVAVLSMFMNNIGALALLMPLAIHMARTGGYSPSSVLMPLAFASMLGGMATLIGTPPNIIVASFRAGVAETSFRMFDFAPVGLIVLGAGALYLIVLGWRLTPGRRAADDGTAFEVKDYVTELRVEPESRAAGLTVASLEREIEGRPSVLGLMRGGDGPMSLGRLERLREGDVLLVQVEPEQIRDMAQDWGLSVVDPGADETLDVDAALRRGEVTVQEAVVGPASPLVGTAPGRTMLRQRYGVFLIAMSRQGQPIRRRLRDVPIRSGDVLMLQGEKEGMGEALRSMGCLPLAPRTLNVLGRRSLLPFLIFAAGVVPAAAGVLPAAIGLAVALGLMVVLNLLTLRQLYDSIELPILVLLGAMIPVGNALAETGATDLLSSGIVQLAGALPLWMMLGLVMLATMTLSDLMNNAATAVVMSPLAIGIALQLGVSPDPFLMAVAVGASCAFLTPIGHQNNTLVMGPGGYRFGDYWPVGLPLELIVLVVGVPAIMLAWPF